MAKVDIQQKVIDNLKALRNARELSQQDVYNDINVHIGRIESSKGSITLHTLIKLSEYYKVDIVDLFR